MITWNESMSTGNARLDFQHQVLFGKLNELSAAIEGDTPGVELQTASDILDFLEYYTEWHFSQEEQIMRERSNPATAQNIQEHADFHRRFAEFHESWLNSELDRSMAIRIQDELTRWIRDHILRVDIQLRENQ
jgi:hemerythrin